MAGITPASRPPISLILNMCSALCQHLNISKAYIKQASTQKPVTTSYVTN